MIDLKLGFPFANFCAIFAERNAKFFFLCASLLREKKQQFAIRITAFDRTFSKTDIE